MFRFLFFFLVVSTVGGCSLVSQKESIHRKYPIKNNSVFEIVVLPHHNLTGERIDKFYADTRIEFGSFDRVIVISPDHFSQAIHPIVSSPPSITDICYEGVCVPTIGLDGYDFDGDFTIFSNTGSTWEHGIGEHIKRVNRYFPGTPVTPVILKRKLSSSDLDRGLASAITDIRDKRVLVIVSVDFSHHVREEFARLHDIKSVEVLNSSDISAFSSIEVDCRNCLAVGRMVAERVGKNSFQLLDRTSVDTVSYSGSDIENTSHIFGRFTEDTILSQTGVFLFAGDTHYARGFTYFEDKIDNYRQKLTTILYQKYDTSNNLQSKYHRIFSGFDEVIVNSESAIAVGSECPKSGKSTQMFTDPSVLPYFASLGITMASVANNHSHDCGKELFKMSKGFFASGGINSFGYDDIAFRTIRGNQFAFVGINIIEDHPDFTKIHTTIQSLTHSGYLVIVNIHWGTEYDTLHNALQEDIGHALVDAGARLIIGHHPHVVQDSEIYKGIPIYYSLGNFIFDQPFPETLRGLLVGCEVSHSGTICQEVSIFRDSKNYSLHF